jgi:hypothetical protein
MFSDHRVVQNKFVPQGQTFNQNFFRKVHEWLLKRVMCIQTMLALGLMHHYNVPCRNVLPVTEVLMSKHSAVVHSPSILHMLPTPLFSLPKDHELPIRTAIQED